jgi:hypothetical protein
MPSPCRQPPQNVKVRVPTNGLQTSRFVTPPAAGWPAATHWLPVDANAPADCVNEKDLQMQAFFEAAEGIRTLDLLHGKQSLQLRFHAQSRWKQKVFEALGTREDSPAFHGKPRGLGHRTGTRAASSVKDNERTMSDADGGGPAGTSTSCFTCSMHGKRLNGLKLVVASVRVTRRRESAITVPPT